MKTIQLTQGYCTFVDDDDHEDVSLYNWYATKCGNKIYAKNSDLGYLHIYLLQPPEEFQVDHINNNSLDNRQKNLRKATVSQNQANRQGPTKANKSRYLGVYWHKNAERWVAQVQYKKTKYYLGLFDDPEEAALIRDAKALELFGEFVTLNFPEKRLDTSDKRI